MLEDILQREWHHTRVPIEAVLRVRLARPGLPVGEQNRLVAVENLLHQRLKLGKNVLLRVLLGKHPVKLELNVPILCCPVNRLLIHRHIRQLLLVTLLVWELKLHLVRRWTNTDCDPNPPLQLLNLILQLLDSLKL